MKTLATIVTNAGRTPAEFSAAYLHYVGHLLTSIDPSSVAEVIEHLDAARRGGQTVFVIGNGGSAATASHMANDLGMCPPVAEGALRAVALTDGVPLMTAIANDYGYAHIFRRQLEIHYRTGDLLVVISASGNSPNLLEAAEWVKARGGAVIGLLGFDGGRLASLCDASVIARTAKGEYGPVEDVHMVLDHLVTTWFSKDRFGKAAV